MRLYAIYDKVAMEAGPVFSAKNDGVAMRQFLNTMPANVSRQEFQLLAVAEYSVDPVSVEGINPPLEVVVELAKEVV